jgi:hypothetical protein
MKNQRTVIAVPTDTHSGSKVGLINADEQYTMSDGGFYNPGFTQKIIWNQWKESWEHIRELRKKSRLVVVHCGDSVEGVHHDVTELVNTNISDHKQIHKETMDWALKKARFEMEKGDLLYYISGTSSHCGPNNGFTNDVAEDLCAVPCWENRYHWGMLPLMVNGTLLYFQHEGVRKGIRAWTEENVLRYYTKSEMMDAIGNKRPVPRFIVMAHNHTYVRSGIVYAYGNECEGVILPAFQAKTDFVYKKKALAMASVGMFYIVVNEDGSVECGADLVEIEQDKIQEI